MFWWGATLEELFFCARHLSIEFSSLSWCSHFPYELFLSLKKEQHVDWREHKFGVNVTKGTKKVAHKYKSTPNNYTAHRIYDRGWQTLRARENENVRDFCSLRISFSYKFYINLWVREIMNEIIHENFFSLLPFYDFKNGELEFNELS